MGFPGWCEYGPRACEYEVPLKVRITRSVLRTRGGLLIQRGLANNCHTGMCDVTVLVCL